MIALNWLTRVFEPQTREKAAGRKRFLILDGHSSHLSLRLLRKAREFNIDIIIYPSHCTHLLQGLDVICFAPLKQNWAHEIKMFECEEFRGVKRDDFAKVFGNAYKRTFTPPLILKAWEATGVFPFNDKIIPPEKMAPSEMSTIKYTSSVIHSTPVWRVMEAFSFFKPPHLDLSAVDVEDEEESPAHTTGGVIILFSYEKSDEPDAVTGMTGGSAEPVTPRKQPRSDSLENPFIEPFTPSKRMKILRASLASSSSASYLVSSSPITADAHIITPQREEPEPYLEPDWNSLLNTNAAYREEEDLLRKVDELQRGLLLVRDCLRAREAVIESAHATNVVLELTCQRQ